MNLTISGHHIDITPSIREYTKLKIDRLARHFDMLIEIKVTLSIDKSRDRDTSQKAECTIHVKGHDIFAEATHSDLYVAIDALVDKLDRQMLKYKERRQEHQSA